MTVTTTDRAMPRPGGRALTAAIALAVGLAFGTGATLIATGDEDASRAAHQSQSVAEPAPAATPTREAPVSADAAEHWAGSTTVDRRGSADAAEHWVEASAGSRIAACASPGRSADAIERCSAGR